MSTVEPIRNKRIHKAKVKLNGGESEFRFFDINSNFVEILDRKVKKRCLITRPLKVKLKWCNCIHPNILKFIRP